MHSFLPDLSLLEAYCVLLDAQLAQLDHMSVAGALAPETN